MNLNWLIIIPLLTVFNILLVPSKQARMIALAGSVLQIIVVLFLLYLFVQQPDASLSGAMLLVLSVNAVLAKRQQLASVGVRPFRCI